MRILIAALGLSLFAAPAAAQQPSSDWIFGANGEDLVLEVGGGPKLTPAYEGADDYTFVPWAIVDLRYLHLPGIGTFGGGPEGGFSFGPSFRFVRARDSGDYSQLSGLSDVDFAVEVGGKAAYRYDMIRGSLAVRRGFGGHNGFVVDLGLDAVVDPTPELSVSFGPRLYLASDDYMQTYFGVTPAESAASGLAAFDPSGWLKGAGVEGEMRYALSRHWAVRGKAGYERLLADAADSPITRAGSRNQFNAAIGLTYRFGLDLFH